MALLQVPITKGKGTIEVDTEKLPDAVYAEALAQGLKVIYNRGMSKITKETYPNPDEMKAAAMAKAAETHEAAKAGKIRIMGAKVNKASGAVMTEARRLARNLVKDEMKRQGIKVSYVEASEITKAANALLAAQPELIEQAKEAIKEREAKAEATKEALAGITLAIPVSEKKKAKAEAEKAKAKQLSAAKAGKTEPRKKGQKPAAQPNA